MVPGPSGAQRPGGAPAGDAIAGRSSPAQSQGAPAAASSKGTVLARHAVQPGDTLSRIAAQHYGDARLYHRIVEANRDKLRDPDVLPLGVVLEIPAPPAQPAAGTAATATASPPGTASTPSGRIHVVQPGDTLYRLAAHYLGSGTAYTRIYEANRDQMRSPNDLRVGMRIVIPEG
ncbi:MAG: hypothetical protein KatS3mg102_2455 [Planctomycetota bacterium]|nr:MAG: hypothetical protein KatS3mg102_2455 [Planctomycetota bacterium]